MIGWRVDGGGAAPALEKHMHRRLQPHLREWRQPPVVDWLIQGQRAGSR